MVNPSPDGLTPNEPEGVRHHDWFNHRIHDRVRALPRHVGRGLPAFVALFLIVGGTSIAVAATGGAGAGKFAATFEARAGLPLIEPCPALGPEGQKIENRYRGTMTIDGEEYGIHFVLEALFDRAAGLGSAEGRWQLTDPRTADVMRGELIASSQRRTRHRNRSART
jgi:hypothetical protein